MFQLLKLFINQMYGSYLSSPDTNDSKLAMEQCWVPSPLMTSSVQLLAAQHQYNRDQSQLVLLSSFIWLANYAGVTSGYVEFPNFKWTWLLLEQDFPPAICTSNQWH